MAQWLERVHGKHEVVGSNPARANFLYGIEKLSSKMNIGKFRYTPMITLQIKFEIMIR